MTDRELLELAAKAAGYDFEWFGQHFHIAIDDRRFTSWNPLKDDGDALRLAVKLGIRVYRNNESGYTSCNYVSLGKYSDDFMEFDNANEDEYATTRRAIVRAAAEIGRAS